MEQRAMNYEHWIWQTYMQALHIVSSLTRIFFFFFIFASHPSIVYLYLFVLRFILFCLSSNKYIFIFATIYRAGGSCRNCPRPEVCMYMYVWCIWVTIFTDMIQQNVPVFGNSFRHNKSVESKSFFSNGDLNSISHERHQYGIIYRNLF